MRIYNRTSEAFLKKVVLFAKKIFLEEMSLHFTGKKVHFQGTIFPLDFVVFEGRRLWGYYDHGQYTIGLNKLLMYEAKDEVIKNVLRHELVHFYAHIFYRDQYPRVKAHGEEFRNLCKSFGYDERVYAARSNLELDNAQVIDPEFDKVFSKLQKLLSLQSSDNQHESELATIKANELLLEYNLKIAKKFSANDLSSHANGQMNDLNDLKDLNKMNEELDTCVDVVITAKKSNAKHEAMSSILRHFFVKTVYSRFEDLFALEVVGTRSNVEIAKYIATYLDRQLEEIFLQEKKKNPKLLKGVVAKNSFMRGIALGYKKKLEDYKRQQQQKLQQQQNFMASTSMHDEFAAKNALALIEDDLEERLAQAYPSLSSRKTYARHDVHANSLGQKSGENLKIHTAINSGSSQNSSGTFYLN